MEDLGKCTRENSSIQRGGKPWCLDRKKQNQAMPWCLDRNKVAIKRLNRAYGQGDPELWKEIIMLSRYKHENIVSLLGFCDESGEKILVYEYASKKSLDLYLKSDDLTWIQRLKICIGAARGLAYLHNPGETQQRVLHHDIKSANILLDENWNARISDLGLSKFGPANQQITFLVSNAVGTIGYCDPVYVETGVLTKESDVYSFGVVLFEVLSGRLCIGNNKDKHRLLTGLARECYEENKLHEIIYKNIKDEIKPKSLKAFLAIAYQCLKRDLEERPLMTKVVRVLEQRERESPEVDRRQKNAASVRHQEQSIGHRLFHQSKAENAASVAINNKSIGHRFVQPIIGRIRRKRAIKNNRQEINCSTKIGPKSDWYSNTDRQKQRGRAVWDALKVRHVGVTSVQKARLQTLKTEFEMLHMKENESIDSFTTKLTGIINKAASLGQTYEDSTLVRKLLNSVPDRFLQIVASIEQYSDLDTMSLDEAIGRLKTFEERLKFKKERVVDTQEGLMFTRHEHRGQSNRGCGRGRFNQSRGRGYNRFRSERKNWEPSQNSSRRETISNTTKKFTPDKSKVQCFKCKKYGHYATRCLEKDQDPEHSNLIEEDLEPTLLMATVEEHQKVFLNDQS
ncbi:hypothetical protein OSB04_030452 [Centaurea solstitialis]|uniref:Uncharacterized protein n=1 Tax=Centaurea solstitialis TaxID=347529 RepID=A0AA38S6Y3_9ASTR|nr:hypothetical protein OSB04_030452 [Centaurea solstitialis]